MVEGQAMLKLHLPSAKIINNSGVKSIVTKELLQLLDLYDWPTTHHNDLRSAARIALLAMLRDERANNRLAEFVGAALNNKAVIIVEGKKP